MNLSETLAAAASLLDAHGIPDARLEAELLAGHVLEMDRARLYTSLRQEVSASAFQALEELLARRLERWPLAYLLGHREFYGLDLLVSPAVLVPRPETETMVECALLWARAQGGRPLTVADVGTGSGAIAIAVAKALPQVRVLAVDISREALAVAQANARRHGVGDRVALVAGDLLSSVAGPLDLVLANLPYIPDGELRDLQEEVRIYEPRIALEGGPDGLGLVRRLLMQAREVVRPGGAVMLEINPPQELYALQAAGQAFPEAQVRVVRDLAGWERVVEVQIPSEMS